MQPTARDGAASRGTSPSQTAASRQAAPPRGQPAHLPGHRRAAQRRTALRRTAAQTAHSPAHVTQGTAEGTEFREQQRRSRGSAVLRGFLGQRGPRLALLRPHIRAQSAAPRHLERQSRTPVAACLAAPGSMPHTRKPPGQARARPDRGQVAPGPLACSRAATWTCQSKAPMLWGLAGPSRLHTPQEGAPRNRAQALDTPRSTRP